MEISCAKVGQKKIAKILCAKNCPPFSVVWIFDTSAYFILYWKLFESRLSQSRLSESYFNKFSQLLHQCFWCIHLFCFIIILILVSTDTGFEPGMSWSVGRGTTTDLHSLLYFKQLWCIYFSFMTECWL